MPIEFLFLIVCLLSEWQRNSRIIDFSTEKTSLKFGNVFIIWAPAITIGTQITRHAKVDGWNFFSQFGKKTNKKGVEEWIKIAKHSFTIVTRESILYVSIFHSWKKMVYIFCFYTQCPCLQCLNKERMKTVAWIYETFEGKIFITIDHESVVMILSFIPDCVYFFIFLLKQYIFFCFFKCLDKTMYLMCVLYPDITAH